MSTKTVISVTQLTSVEFDQLVFVITDHCDVQHVKTPIVQYSMSINLYLRNYVKIHDNGSWRRLKGSEINCVCDRFSEYLS